MCTRLGVVPMLLAGWGPHLENHLAKKTISWLLETDQSALKFLLNNKSLWYKMK